MSRCLLSSFFFSHFPSSSDLSSNHLSTLHKDSFRGLTHLTLLDLSKNHLDFLPNDLLLDLDSLSNLWVFVTNNIAKSIEKSSLWLILSFRSLQAPSGKQARALRCTAVSEIEELKDFRHQSEPIIILAATRAVPVDLSHTRWVRIYCNWTLLCCPVSTRLRCIWTKDINGMYLYSCFTFILVKLIVKWSTSHTINWAMYRTCRSKLNSKN